MAIKLPKLSKKVWIIAIVVVAVIVLIALISMITALISDTNRLDYVLITNEYIQKQESNANGEKFPYLYDKVGTYAVVDIKSAYRGGIFAKKSLTIPSSYKGKAVTCIISMQSLQRTQKVVLSEGIKSIGNSAFAKGEFATIVVPESVNYIGTFAFMDCKGLKNVTIPSNITTLLDGTFSGCSGLQTITVPNSITSIGKNAFNGCSKLETLTLSQNLAEIGDGAFTNCASLPTVTLPETVTSVGANPFVGCEQFVLTVENGAKYLGSSSNSHYLLLEKESKEITSCTIHAQTVVIAGGAFDGAENLTSISIPNSVKYWGSYAFANCTALSEVTLGDGLTYIPAYAFNGCTALTAIVVPSHIEVINNYAFNGCKELTDVTLNVGLTELGQALFYGCNNLESITFNGTEAQWEAISKRETGNSSWKRGRTDITVNCTQSATEEEQA